MLQGVSALRGSLHCQPRHPERVITQQLHESQFIYDHDLVPVRGFLLPWGCPGLENPRVHVDVSAGRVQRFFASLHHQVTVVW